MWNDELKIFNHILSLSNHDLQYLGPILAKFP